MAARAVVDLHCHTSASFDSLSDPVAVARTATSRGITHLAITDHDRIDGALRARDAANPGLTVIVGSEVRTAQGDLIALFLERPITAGLPAAGGRCNGRRSSWLASGDIGRVIAHPGLDCSKAGCNIGQLPACDLEAISDGSNVAGHSKHLAVVVLHI